MAKENRNALNYPGGILVESIVRTIAFGIASIFAILFMLAPYIAWYFIVKFW